MPYRPVLIVMLLLSALDVSSQLKPVGVMHLRGGSTKFAQNIDEWSPSRLLAGRNTVMGRSFHFVRLDHLPTAGERSQLQQAGIDLLDYVPDNVYVMEVRQPEALSLLKKLGAQGIMDLDPAQKIAPGLLAAGGQEGMDLQLLFFSSIPFDTAARLLSKAGFILDSPPGRELSIASLHCRRSDLLTLASFPFIRYIDRRRPGIDLQDRGSGTYRDEERANVLRTGLPQGYNLTGKGVSVGVLELSGPPQKHVDFADRLVPLTPDIGTDNTHSTLVNGIVGGAGSVNELYTGMAPAAKLLASNSNTPQVPLKEILVTNRSFGFGIPCDTTGMGLTGMTLDQQSLDFPNMLPVCAAGNSALEHCTLYPPGFHTILSGEQSAKSCIAVGSVAPDGTLAYTSSNGPTTDGRIKPELVATGFGVVSTSPTDIYAKASGTSLSSPTVAGGIALLCEEYRKLHNGGDPSNALMKAIVCNSATDMGNPGPDFSYGFGWMDLLRAVAILDSVRYFSGAVVANASDIHSISVRSNTAQLKVMLYWQDFASSPFSGPALVNDLDLQVIGPDGVTVLPYILDTVPANVGLAATRGEDHINNIEQVVIDHPQAGFYSIRIKAHAIAQGSGQNYVVTYDPVPVGVVLSYPFGGAHLLPGELTTIQWDSYGDSGPFDLQFSPDNGQSWQAIATVADPAKRQYSWTVPALATEKALVRLLRTPDGATNTTAPFIIAGVPAIALTPDQCPGSISLSWPAVAGATDYEVMILRNGTMQRVDTTTALSYRVHNLSLDSTYWVTVRSRIHGIPGRRAVALSRRPADGVCADPAYNGDLAADSLIAPLSGRKYTSASLGTQEAIRLRIKNYSGQPASGYTVKYQVNGGPWISETGTVSLAPGAATIHSFSTPVDLFATGSYSLVLVVVNPGDPNSGNDTLRCLVRSLDNPALALSSTITDDFSKAADTSYDQSFTGLEGADRFDYYSNNRDGILQTHADHPIPANGKGLQTGYPLYNEAGEYNTLTATYNLSAFDTAGHNAGIYFSYAKTDPYGTSGNWVAFRGSDTQPWLNILDLAPGLGSGLPQKARITDFSARLRAAGQNYSSSFQIRWTQTAAAINYSFDTIQVFDATHDLELIRIDSIAHNSCNLGKTMPVHVSLRNNQGKALDRVPVYYRVDGGAIITDTVASLPAGDTIAFTFHTPADLSAPGPHSIEAGIDTSGDPFPDNNVKKYDFHNQSLISQFPYLQNFEAGQGSWYAEGNNTSWAYGHPASAIINGAASGVKAWKTNLTGSFNAYESGSIYSPFFDLSGLKTPTVSFSVALNSDSCGVVLGCTGLIWMYSVDSGKTWLLLPVSSPFHWTQTITSLHYNRWHVASNTLPAGLGVVQFRLWFRSQAFHGREGVAVDDIHIYDGSLPIYEHAAAGDTILSIKKTLAGGQDWVNFIQDGQVVASIQPNGQDLGSMELQSFLRQGTVRSFHGQYYASRNWTIHPSHVPDHPVGVRLYFTDAESDAMVFAGDCPVCTNPPDAYRLGLSQYSTDSSREENDSISDDLYGSWSFLDSSRVRIVPYGRGYYAEFTTDHFSEFRLNNGGPDGKSWLPVNIKSFTARKVSSTSADLQWSTAAEIDIDHFEIQRADGDAARAKGNFITRGTLASKGSSRQQQDYSFQDPDSSRNGATGDPGPVWYRIKAIDVYGHYSYSPPASVLFSNETKWLVFPNPSSGHFTLQYQLDNGQTAEMDIYNAVGVRVGRKVLTGSGSIQTTDLDLSRAAYPAGVYFVKVLSPENKVFRLVKVGK